MRKVISMLLFVASVPVFGQVSLQFVPELHGRSIDGLLNLRILNASGPKTVRLNLVVTERKYGKIVNIKTETFTLINGNSTVPFSAVRSAKIQFGGSQISNAIQQNGYFPEGDYEYCFTIEPSSNSMNAEVAVDQCFNYEVVPSAPLMLIEPYNQDKICEKRPLLSWQPSFPQISGSAYQLVLVEIKERQNATEALNYNLPIITQSGIVNPILPYPASSKELSAGKKYAWQVSAYKNRTVINRSEVWEFTVDCKDDLESPEIKNDGYRDIEDLARGNYYIANGLIKFALVNSYQKQYLKYTIQCITDQKISIKNLPKVNLDRGKNNILIPLQKRGYFKSGYYYELKVSLPNGNIKRLRFIYKESNENLN